MLTSWIEIDWRSLVCAFEREKGNACCCLMHLLHVAICSLLVLFLNGLQVLCHITKTAAFVEWPLHLRGTLMKAVSLSNYWSYPWLAFSHLVEVHFKFNILLKVKRETSLSLSPWNPLSISAVNLRYDIKSYKIL